MDQCYQMQANYSLDHLNDYRYDSGKHHLHTESGYDSLLATSANSTSFFQNSIINESSNDSSLFSLPTTPVKSSTKTQSKLIHNGNNCSTTPDFKQQYIADINGMYFKTIRSSYDSSDNYSSSQSQSPKVFSANNEAYIHSRDHISSKLLRSPAFKLESSYSPQQPLYQPIERPSIKSFSSRFAAEMPKFEGLSASQIKPTPTESEFMQMLISNHHIPDNPEFLIGRNMGIENVNIMSELNKRSMNNVIDKILSYMNVGDVVRMGCVSKEWRVIVKSNPNVNKERDQFIKTRRHIYETTKENHIETNNWRMRDTLENGNKRKLSGAHVPEKSEKYKSSKVMNDIPLQRSSLGLLDVNRLNNIQAPINQSSYQQRRRLLERQFGEFSITDEPVFRMSPTKRSPMKQRSPLKRHSPIKNAGLTTPLICSKKSKKNLKRL